MSSMDRRESDAIAFSELGRTLRECRAAATGAELADLLDRALEMQDAWARERLHTATEAVRN